jgi:uncharacterized membrane protein
MEQRCALAVSLLSLPTWRLIMSDSKTLNPVESAPVANDPVHNVHGWERAGSLLVGVASVVKGVRRGGIFGLVQLAIGGVALARGFTGHSRTKSLIEKSRQEMDGVRAQIERAGAELTKLKDNAVAATESATVTGDDSLKTPKV